jgi:AmmeMemoRadiSam system radical SAM enzyme
VCPRECKLHEGQQGLCFVRANKNDQIVLTTYGQSGGFCVDPIEKKPLNHFLPVTPILFFGTAGCNLVCKFCQNWDMSKSREMDMSFSNQVLSVIYLAKQKAKLTNSVHNVPIKIDDEISRLKLQAMNIHIDQLTDAQARYLSSWQEGT